MQRWSVRAGASRGTRPSALFHCAPCLPIRSRGNKGFRRSNKRHPAAERWVVSRPRVGDERRFGRSAGRRKRKRFDVRNVSGYKKIARRARYFKLYGGSAWESNPPAGLFTRHTGFEVRESHQYPFHFRSGMKSTTCHLEKQLFLILFHSPTGQVVPGGSATRFFNGM